MEPTHEQVAWATMVVGEMHFSHGNESNGAVRGWLFTMLLARMLAQREARDAKT